jgi:hypothetical protein
MRSQYHIEITRKALDAPFSKNALAVIIQAHISQDRFVCLSDLA